MIILYTDKTQIEYVLGMSIPDSFVTEEPRISICRDVEDARNMVRDMTSRTIVVADIEFIPGDSVGYIYVIPYTSDVKYSFDTTAGIIRRARAALLGRKLFGIYVTMGPDILLKNVDSIMGRSMKLPYPYRLILTKLDDGQRYFLSNIMTKDMAERYAKQLSDPEMGFRVGFEENPHYDPTVQINK